MCILLSSKGTASSLTGRIRRCSLFLLRLAWIRHKNSRTQRFWVLGHAKCVLNIWEQKRSLGHKQADPVNIENFLSDIEAAYEEFTSNSSTSRLSENSKARLRSALAIDDLFAASSSSGGGAVLSLSCQVSCILHGWTHQPTLSHPSTSQISLTYLTAGFIARPCHTSARRRLAATVKSLSPPVDVMPSVLHSASPPSSASAVVGTRQYCLSCFAVTSVSISGGKYSWIKHNDCTPRL
jgi:hypothetical protein